MKIARLAAAEIGTEIGFSSNNPGLRASFELWPDSFWGGYQGNRERLMPAKRSKSLFPKNRFGSVI